MIKSTNSVPRHSCSFAHRPMLYGNEEFVANGTVLSVTANEWRVAGPMPVHAGMQLSLRVWPPEMSEGFHLEGATVLWVKGQEFAVEVQDVSPPVDRKWLPHAGRDSRLWLVP